MPLLKETAETAKRSAPSNDEADSNKRPYQTNAASKPQAVRTLSHIKGHQAIIGTSDSGKERQAVKELLTLLDEAANDLYPKSVDNTGQNDAADGEQASSLTAMIEAEAAALRTQRGSQQRFASLKSDLRGIIVICVMDRDVDILVLVRYICAQITEKRERRSRFIVRLSPLTHTCYSDLANMTETATPLVTEAFANLTAAGISVRWAVHLNRRSTGLPRNETLTMIADLVSGKHTVDLKDPDVVVLIDTCKCVAGISLLADFKTTGYSDFHIRSLQDRVCGVRDKSNDAD